MTRILWIGDAAVETGFGRVTDNLTSRLVDRGHEVAILAINYRGDSPPTKVTMYRANGRQQEDIMGYTRVVEVLGAVDPDVVVLLNDPYICLHYIFRNDFDPKFLLLRYRPLVTYQARDGLNPPATWDRLREVTGAGGEVLPVSRQVAMSKFGQAQMPGSDLVYHGIDSALFHPASREHPVITSNGRRITSKREAKESFGYPPDVFLVLRVDRNSYRKDFASTWKSMLPSMAKHPDIVTHFHCRGHDKGGGPQMPELWTRDLATASRFYLSKDIDTYTNWSVGDLAALYNAADLFVTTSMGEGFGLTIAEAMACGVPVIAQNASAIPEVVGPGGMLIEPAYTVTAPGGQDFAGANIGAFSEAIEHLYLNEGFRKRYAKAAVQHVRDTFNWDTETAKMERILVEQVERTALVPVEASA